MRPLLHSRRTALAALGAAALVAGKGFAQEPPAFDQRLTPEEVAKRRKDRTRPMLCVYSGCFAKLPVALLPQTIGGMGFEGVDLTVMPGGHVDPSKYMVQMDRAFQMFQDAALDVPMISTTYTSASQPFAYQVLYVSAELGARFCKLGAWPPPGAVPGQNPAFRSALLRNDLNQLAATSLQCRIASLIPNHAGSYPGRSITELNALMPSMGKAVLGYCFEPAQSVIESGSPNGWESELRAALPRLGAVSLADVAIPKDQKDQTDAAPTPCPLGEGVIDWKKFFSILAEASFRGPLSLRQDYMPRNAFAALTKDVAFVRARLDEAWPA
ncbi:MAG TPA: sugar phosphate isomerase/epimerase [Bryobacteraceae bacterium]|nr:sugar phosphate isomerase/epimerase [Bryobacteraceae bacterium]